MKAKIVIKQFNNKSIQFLIFLSRINNKETVLHMNMCNIHYTFYILKKYERIDRIRYQFYKSGHFHKYFCIT